MIRHRLSAGLVIVSAMFVTLTGASQAADVEIKELKQTTSRHDMDIQDSKNKLDKNRFDIDDLRTKNQDRASRLAAIEAMVEALKQDLANIQLTPGPAGPQGLQGLQGEPGIAGPVGPAGLQGPTGLSCWDLNGNGVQDTVEDTNSDGVYNALDCAGSVNLTPLIDRLAYLEARLSNSDFDNDGYTPITGDCDDSKFDVNPNGSEGNMADGLDNNCDGMVDNLSNQANIPTGIVISELTIGNSLNQTELFVEIYNTDSNTRDISGLEIQYCSASCVISSPNWITWATVNQGVYIGGNAFYLAAGPNYSASIVPDVISPVNYISFASAGGHIRFMINGVELDHFAWGSALFAEGMPFTGYEAGTLVVFERKANVTSTPATMDVGGVDFIKGNGYDSNNNFYDFIVKQTPEPQNSVSIIEIP